MGWIHVTAASAALMLGLILFLLPRGPRLHRHLGTVYVILMLTCNLAALSIYDSSAGIGPFHILALVSLATVIPAAWLAVRRPAGWARPHGILMRWSWIGLVGAGLGQFWAHALPNSNVGAVIALTSLAGALWIHGGNRPGEAMLRRLRGCG